jgi:hypothetical protein
MADPQARKARSPAPWWRAINPASGFDAVDDDHWHRVIAGSNFSPN